jgi:hypothetical protein
MQADGSYQRFPNAGPPSVNPFGWGAGAVDYDNDADTDLIYYGSLDQIPFLFADNPGVVFKNDGSGGMSWDRGATIRYEEHVQRQNVHGVALGDLNGDGFNDIVYASSQYAPRSLPLVPASHMWGSPFDVVAKYIPTFSPIGPLEWEWNGIDLDDGFLGVQLSSASTGSRWAKVRVLGGKGLTGAAKNNRSGIGAVVKFTPTGGKTAMTPVLGGSSHASQHALDQGFGLGARSEGIAEVLWPGGVKNRLYAVRHGETVTMPEIPCDFARGWPSRDAYTRCVDSALADFRRRAVISGAHSTRLRASALRAYDAAH